MELNGNILRTSLFNREKGKGKMAYNRNKKRGIDRLSGKQFPSRPWIYSVTLSWFAGIGDTMPDRIRQYQGKRICDPSDDQYYMGSTRIIWTVNGTEENALGRGAGEKQQRM